MYNEVSLKKLREFGLFFGICFPLFFGCLIPLFSGHEFRLWTFLLGFLSFGLGLVKPILLFYPYKIWIKIGNSLGWLNSKIILGLIFFIILFPIACLMKFFRYDPLRQNKKTNTNTYKEKKIDHLIDLTRIF